MLISIIAKLISKHQWYQFSFVSAGPLFCHPVHAAIGMNYIDRCWEIYQAFCHSNPDVFSEPTMTARQFIWMFKVQVSNSASSCCKTWNRSLYFCIRISCLGRISVSLTMSWPRPEFWGSLDWRTLRSTVLLTATWIWRLVVLWKAQINISCKGMLRIAIACLKYLKNSILEFHCRLISSSSLRLFWVALKWRQYMKSELLNYARLWREVRWKKPLLANGLHLGWVQGFMNVINVEL